MLGASATANGGLSRIFGSDNTLEAKVARGMIEGLLRKYSKTWGALIAFARLRRRLRRRQAAIQLREVPEI